MKLKSQEEDITKTSTNRERITNNHFSCKKPPFHRQEALLKTEGLSRTTINQGIQFRFTDTPSGSPYRDIRVTVIERLPGTNIFHSINLLFETITQSIRISLEDGRTHSKDKCSRNPNLSRPPSSEAAVLRYQGYGNGTEPPRRTFLTKVNLLFEAITQPIGISSEDERTQKHRKDLRNPKLSRPPQTETAVPRYRGYGN